MTAADDRPPTTRPAPDEVEPGIPATSETRGDVPPGWEAEEEPAPLDVPQAVNEWGTTAREEALGESVVRRAWREEPDFGQPGREPAGGDGLQVYEPGADEGGEDLEADAVAELDLSGEQVLAAEEAAMRIEDEPAGLSYADDPGYVEDEA